MHILGSDKGKRNFIMWKLTFRETANYFNLWGFCYFFLTLSRKNTMWKGQCSIIFSCKKKQKNIMVPFTADIFWMHLRARTAEHFDLLNPLRSWLEVEKGSSLCKVLTLVVLLSAVVTGPISLCWVELLAVSFCFFANFL